MSSKETAVARELGQQVARALVRLDDAVDRGHPWLTAQQIDVPSAALGVLVEAGYAAKRLWAGLPEYRITRQAGDFLADLTDRLALLVAVRGGRSPSTTGRPPQHAPRSQERE